MLLLVVAAVGVQWLLQQRAAWELLDRTLVGLCGFQLRIVGMFVSGPRTAEICAVLWVRSRHMVGYPGWG